jgi:hypothetical protein
MRYASYLELFMKRFANRNSRLSFLETQQLILKRTGTLKLKLRCPGDQNLAHLCDGIKFTRTLACIDLSLSLHAQLPHLVSVVLSSIASNCSLRRATLYFEVRSHDFELLSCCAPFTAMIRDNAALEYVSFKIDCFEFGQVMYLEEVLPALVKGLEHNRTLRSIHFHGNERNPISRSASRSLVEVLQRPGLRLKTIEGLSYESAEDKRVIEYLCYPICAHVGRLPVRVFSCVNALHSLEADDGWPRWCPMLSHPHAASLLGTCSAGFAEPD